MTSVVSDSVQPHRHQPIRLPPGILQARTLQWVAISSSNAWKWKVKSESEVAQSCPTLSDPMDCSLPGSSIHGIFQARVLEWGAIAFSIYSSMYLLIPNSLFIPPPSLSVTISLFPMSVSLFLICNEVHLYHFFRFHIKMIWYLSLSDLIQSFLAPNILLEMTLFRSILWLSNIPVCECVCVCVCLYTCIYIIQSCVTLCNPWTVAHQAPLSVGEFSRQEYCSG